MAEQWRIQDFPEEGTPTSQGGRQHTILPKFPKNCMKLKEFGPPGRGRASPTPPLDPPLLKSNKSKFNKLKPYLQIKLIIQLCRGCKFDLFLCCFVKVLDEFKKF